MFSRRRFINISTSVTLAGAGLGGALIGCRGDVSERSAIYRASDRLRQFQEILTTPVLDTRSLRDPVMIESIDIYRHGQHYFIKVTSTNGEEGIASGNPKYIESLYPIMINRIARWILRRDARDLETLIEEVYLKGLNYKWQGLPFWVSLAYIEIAILDLLGRTAGKAIGDLLGGRRRDTVAIYYPSGNRTNSPEEEVVHLQGLIAKSGAKAVKIRLGARMFYNDASTKRDRALIPLVRKTLGDEVTVYTDANGSYDVPMAVSIGRLLEEHNAAFFEEPVPFDYYEETRAVAEQLTIPIAGGEVETSMRQFMWLMDRDVLSIVQPDILFFGGLIRSIKVARMAESLGVDCTPHISGKALGFLYMLQFASCVPNIGSYQEFKGNSDGVPVVSASSSLQAHGGYVDIPREPGLGVEFDPDFIRGAEKITTI